MDILKIFGMFGLAILMILIQVFWVTVVYQDLSKWTVLPYFDYAKILCFVLFIYLLKAIFIDNLLTVQAYERLSINERIIKQLSHTVTMGLFVLVYFVAKRWVV